MIFIERQSSSFSTVLWNSLHFNLSLAWDLFVFMLNMRKERGWRRRFKELTREKKNRYFFFLSLSLFWRGNGNPERACSWLIEKRRDFLMNGKFQLIIIFDLMVLRDFNWFLFLPPGGSISLVKAPFREKKGSTRGYCVSVSFNSQQVHLACIWRQWLPCDACYLN